MVAVQSYAHRDEPGGASRDVGKDAGRGGRFRLGARRRGRSGNAMCPAGIPFPATTRARKNSRQWCWPVYPRRGRNRSGRPLSQNLQYSDTPTQPLVPMHFIDATAVSDGHHTYRVIAVNTVGQKSAPTTQTAAAPTPGKTRCTVSGWKTAAVRIKLEAASQANIQTGKPPSHERRIPNTGRGRRLFVHMLTYGATATLHL